MGNKRMKKTKKVNVKGTRAKRSGRLRSGVPWLVAVVIGFALVVLGSVVQDEKGAVASPIEFTDVRTDTKEFLAYNKSIELTPEQELVKKKALSGIRAPCCSDKTAHTCCCPCNVAKTWWGLSNHLIADEGFGAEEVRTAVEAWLDFMNPEGFSGDACYTRGCNRPFHRNGCGGMNESRVIF